MIKSRKILGFILSLSLFGTATPVFADKKPATTQQSVKKNEAKKASHLSSLTSENVIKALKFLGPDFIQSEELQSYAQKKVLPRLMKNKDYLKMLSGKNFNMGEFFKIVITTTMKDIKGVMKIVKNIAEKKQETLEGQIKETKDDKKLAELEKTLKYVKKVIAGAKYCEKNKHEMEKLRKTVEGLDFNKIFKKIAKSGVWNEIGFTGLGANLNSSNPSDKKIKNSGVKKNIGIKKQNFKTYNKKR